MTLDNRDNDFQIRIEDSIRRLLDYCKSNDWAGYDPFDGLNSRIFASTPFVKNRFARLAFIQFMKRCPINLRKILLVPKEQNPKGLALFASSLIKLQDCGFLNDPELIDYVIKRIIELKTQNSEFYCWGYNFDWQNRNFFLPKFSPNIICTTFCANALLDFFDKTQEKEYLDMALSAGDFLLSGLNITENDSGGLCFSYTPFDHGQVHNANLLGAAFLSRLHNITGKNELFDAAFQATNFSIKKQKPDGSWPYGEDENQRWIDNFHTAYNLIALNKICKFLGNGRFMDSIENGYQFYKENFFIDSSIPKYYHDSVHPIDIHSVALSIITPIELKDIDKEGIQMSYSIFKWAQNNMQSSQGSYNYQHTKYYKNKVPYMRWSQAWMLYGLSSLLCHSHNH